MNDVKAVDKPAAETYSEKSLFNIATRSRAMILLFALLLQIFLSAFEFKVDLLPFILRTGTILAAIFMASDKKQHLFIGLSLGIPGLVLGYFTRGVQFEALDWVNYVFVLTLYLFIIKLMLEHIFLSKEITLDTIGMALCTYILIGIVWLLFYTPVVAADPQAFSQSVGETEFEITHTLMYFSFTTLTTLGYGDISPVSPIARSLAILEALSGTLFMAVLISRLVGSYRSRKRD